MATVKFVLKTQQKDKAGKCPLYIRVIKNRNARFISLGIKLLPSEWDEDQQRVRKNYPNSTRMNAVLITKIADASMEIIDEERKTKNISASDLKEAVQGKKSINYFEYADQTLEKMYLNITENTYRVYKSQLNKFRKFVGSEVLLLEGVTVSLIKEYVHYSMSVKKNQPSSVKNSLIPLSSIYNSAVNDGLIGRNSYPFDKIHIKVSPHKRNFLTIDQFEALKRLTFKKKNWAPLARDLFVFSVSAGGLRFGDIITLQWKEIDLQQCVINRRISKTGRLHRLKIGPSAMEVINRYQNTNHSPNDFVFPAISAQKFLEGDRAMKRLLIVSANTICGIQLKQIGEKLKWPFKLHFHLSRHTFATMALNNGMRIEYVSKLMDHSRISTTEIYASVLDEELDKAVDQFVI